MLISNLDHGNDISNFYSSFPIITSHTVESISWPQITSEIRGGCDYSPHFLKEELKQKEVKLDQDYKMGKPRVKCLVSLSL